MKITDSSTQPFLERKGRLGGRIEKISMIANHRVYLSIKLGVKLSAKLIALRRFVKRRFEVLKRAPRIFTNEQ